MDKKINVNKRYKGIEKGLSNSNETIIKDIEFLLTDKADGLSEQAKYDIVHKIAWEWTEGQTTSTKYYGCRYWSKAAFEEKFEKVEGSEKTWKYSKKNVDGLRHEHVVPKKLFIEYIWRLVKNKEEVNVEELLKLMNNNLLACVVTKDEDGKLIKDKLPAQLEDNVVFIEEFEKIKNPWARYEIAQAKGEMSEIYEIEWLGNKQVKIEKRKDF